MAAPEEVSNKQVLLKNYVAAGLPKESDMEIRTTTVKLKVPEGTKDAVLLKILYLSCDPYLRGRMRKIDNPFFAPFELGSPMYGYGVGKVLDSSHPVFKKGDLVWGITAWEEYSFVESPGHLFCCKYREICSQFC